MTSPRTVLRLTLPPALSALLLAVAGSLSTASAETYWTFRNDHEGTCLTSSTTTGNVWSATCNDSLATRRWYWTNDFEYGGHRWGRLVSSANGDCLTSDYKTETNVVWTSNCGNGGWGQIWSGDSNRLTNWLGPMLRTSANGDAVYTSPITVVDKYGIESTRFRWWGAHS
ncbi:hypothetical protein IM697_22670 [Streptomyces ferrugineus]|uniref:Ricin B lectin domain-containing protein n=1 Tax=Streptomyces ferrugineus TaxID=1413221 RepID=A0A7M2SX24_9ACTN|nr:hypothetical protein [Streptomyces ferrugineus]QOV40930.1 hypothetical protein IM697_22670 [Streptomyces ferrugineus]